MEVWFDGSGWSCNLAHCHSRRTACLQIALTREQVFRTTHRPSSRCDSSASYPFATSREPIFMKISSVVAAALLALIVGGVTSARADEGGVALTIYKAGWIIGGSGG